ncbi:MAG: GC-type dockerin domain-anchored protein [Phycisphaerales bacterium JB039]
MNSVIACACAGAVALAAPAQGQDLVAYSVSETRVLEDACLTAGLTCFSTTGFDRFMLEFDSREWPLVVIEAYFDLQPERKARLLPALEAHLGRGGRLLLAYTELDSWPELQELVGVGTFGDITSVQDIWSVDPPHPIWDHPVGFPILGGMDFWDDNGDLLSVAPGGYVLATWFFAGGPPAMAITRGGQVVVNGFDFDAFDGFVNGNVKNQLLWLLDCQADLDDDDALTLFDFLAFQNLFAAGDLKADFAFDGRLDLFDFLEFQNQFDIGCP